MILSLVKSDQAIATSRIMTFKITKPDGRISGVSTTYANQPHESSVQDPAIHREPVRKINEVATAAVAVAATTAGLSNANITPQKQVTHFRIEHK